jgi:hypothetical protein
MSRYRDSLDPKGQADLDKLTALHQSGYDGWVGEDNEPATEANTDPRVWDALQSGPFRSVDEYRSSD